MTQAALQFDAHTLLLGLLGMVCGFLAYWGTRLEQRVDELKARQCLLAEEMHKSYVPREDCRERTAQILGGLERADEKLDRIADAIRTGLPAVLAEVGIRCPPCGGHRSRQA